MRTLALVAALCWALPALAVELPESVPPEPPADLFEDGCPEDEHTPPQELIYEVRLRVVFFPTIVAGKEGHVEADVSFNSPIDDGLLMALPDPLMIAAGEYIKAWASGDQRVEEEKHERLQSSALRWWFNRRAEKRHLRQLEKAGKVPTAPPPYEAAPPAAAPPKEPEPDLAEPEELPAPK